MVRAEEIESGQNVDATTLQSNGCNIQNGMTYL